MALLSLAAQRSMACIVVGRLWPSAAKRSALTRLANLFKCKTSVSVLLANTTEGGVTHFGLLSFALCMRATIGGQTTVADVALVIASARENLCASSDPKGGGAGLQRTLQSDTNNSIRTTKNIKLLKFAEQRISSV